MNHLKTLLMETEMAAFLSPKEESNVCFRLFSIFHALLDSLGLLGILSGHPLLF